MILIKQNDTMIEWKVHKRTRQNTHRKDLLNPKTCYPLFLMDKVVFIYLFIYLFLFNFK